MEIIKREFVCFSSRGLYGYPLMSTISLVSMEIILYIINTIYMDTKGNNKNDIFGRFFILDFRQVED